ncbi:MAG: hypothetical protein LBM17_09165, partial [Candidatus Accumulibacter sp.]|nr:hypothetical protein [Accumulibacter sp.]
MKTPIRPLFSTLSISFRVAVCALVGFSFAACDGVTRARSADDISSLSPTREDAATPSSTPTDPPPPSIPSSPSSPSSPSPSSLPSPAPGAADRSVDADGNLSGFQNFGDPNFDRLVGKTRVLRSHKAPAGTVLRITQFGDSHTASDTITSGLRQIGRA